VSSTRLQKLANWIPLGTLAVLLVAFAVTRSTRVERPRVPIQAAPAHPLAPLEFPAREATLRGRVLDDQGGPVDQALVWLSVQEELAFVETEPDGSFAFERVQSGPRTFNVLANGFEPERFEREEQAAAELVLTKRRAGAPVLAEFARADLAGRVENPGGAQRDLTGYVVALAPEDPPETLGAPIPVRAECARDGSFAFPGLLAGRYVVALLPPFAADGSWPDLLRPWNERARVRFEHGAGDGPHELVLRSIAASVRGVLRDTAGGALAGAYVEVTPAGDPARLWPPLSTEADGSFEFADLPPGRFSLSIRAGGDAVRLELTLAPGEQRTAEVRPLDVARKPN